MLHTHRFALLAPAFACAVTTAAHTPSDTRRATSTSADSVAWAPLVKGTTQRECSASTDSTVPCRVRRAYSAAELRTRLTEGRVVTLEPKDELTFVHEASAETVDLSNGLQYPMSRVVGTNLWVVTLRVPQAERAVVTYVFIPKGKDVARPARFGFNQWRGPLAPMPPLKSSTLHGRVVNDTLASRFLPASRSISAYLPPERGGEPVAGVVYLGDGGIALQIAPYIDTLIVAGRLPRIMLVGIESARRTDSDPADYDPRAMEYLSGYDTTGARFVAHEKFLLQEVIPYAERTWHAPSGRERRSTFGVSNSGGWAIDMGLRNPDAIGRVIAFSPGGRHGQIEEGNRIDPAVRFFLLGGTLEPAFLNIARSWSDSLGARGVSTHLVEVVAGHDSNVWIERFAEAVAWAFTGEKRTTVGF